MKKKCMQFIFLSFLGSGCTYIPDQKDGEGTFVDKCWQEEELPPWIHGENLMRVIAYDARSKKIRCIKLFNQVRNVPYTLELTSYNFRVDTIGVCPFSDEFKKRNSNPLECMTLRLVQCPE